VPSDLNLMEHVDAITSKAASRLYFLKQLRRADVPARDRRGSSHKILEAWPLGLFTSPTQQKIHVTIWTALIVSSQFKVLVCIAEHITPVFQSHSEGAPDDNDFPQIIFRAGANSCLINSCNTNTVRCMPSDPGDWSNFKQLTYVIKDPW